ncbi:P-loop containing nucleoside triphosphate hydrolase protein [Lophium mytilinum]|uniref:P-loop containing nucleoside triphosphate hydrolase protein n=1 Tax=Lophium mytilinum TaxID=390894 RepID=A0A6A6QGQ6_9PEZI|nr:P-loop containing nucleoside triphosphate hydrolase protein [Lophium mytilinum]
MTARIPTPPANPEEITIFVFGGLYTGKTRIIDRYWLNQYNTEYYCPYLLNTYNTRMSCTIAGIPCMLTFNEIDIPEEWIRDPTGIDRLWGKLTTFPHAAMLVYEVGSLRTLETLQTTWPPVQRYFERGECRVIKVVAAKSDDVGTVSVEGAVTWAKKVGATFAQCSAREGTGVIEAVGSLVLAVLEQRKREKEVASPQEKTHDPNIPRFARIIQNLRHRICG